MYKTMQEIVCSTNKKQGKKKGVVGEKYNGLLTHFICIVNMIVSMGTGMGTMPWIWGTSLACQEVTGTVRDHIHGYRYKLLYLDKYGYG